jgi:hypothetical protein
MAYARRCLLRFFYINLRHIIATHTTRLRPELLRALQHRSRRTSTSSLTGQQGITFIE